jgi:hypothetical protein
MSMQNYEPMLYNLPMDSLAVYIRVQLLNVNCEVPNIPMPPVETWEIA